MEQRGKGRPRALARLPHCPGAWPCWLCRPAFRVTSGRFTEPWACSHSYSLRGGGWGVPKAGREPRPPPLTRTHSRLFTGRKGPVRPDTTQSPAPTPSLRNPQGRAAGPSPASVWPAPACGSTKAGSLPRRGPFFHWSPAQRAPANQMSPLREGVQGGQEFGAFPQVWIRQRPGLTQHRAPRTGIPCSPTPPPPAPGRPCPSASFPVLPSHPACPQSPALLCLISRKIPTCAREVVRHGGTAWPTAVLDGPRCLAGLHQCRPQLETGLMPGASGQARDTPVGGGGGLCPYPACSEPSSGKGTQARMGASWGPGATPISSCPGTAHCNLGEDPETKVPPEGSRAPTPAPNTEQPPPNP